MRLLRKCSEAACACSYLCPSPPSAHPHHMKTAGFAPPLFRGPRPGPETGAKLNPLPYLCLFLAWLVHSFFVFFRSRGHRVAMLMAGAVGEQVIDVLDEMRQLDVCLHVFSSLRDAVLSHLPFLMRISKAAS